MIDSHISQIRLLVDERLEQLVSEQNVPYNQLFKAARYALAGGGKRIRPLLLIATAEALGADRMKALTAACAIEMIHTYSLIHDDLPCMDNDDFRRGKPTVHRAFPEAHALLAGDFLLTYAFEAITSDPLLSPAKQSALIATLAKAAGGSGMIGGQIMDIDATDKTIDAHTLQLIHRLKTGALINAAVEMGAIVGEASDTEKSHLIAFGNAIGLAFQIVDDILDLIASEEKHGRKTSSDVINGKTTYISLYGLEASKQKAEQQIAIAQANLKAISRDTSILSSIANSIYAKCKCEKVN